MKFILVFIFFPILAYSQVSEPFYYSINSTNGLSSNTIYDIFQDKKGFVFFGTELGIEKYDGVNFEKYKFSGKGSALSNMLETESGKIIARSFYGDIISIQDDSLCRHPWSDYSHKGFPNFYKLKSNIYACEGNKIYQFNPLKDTFLLLKSSINSDVDWIHDVALYQKKSVFITSDDKYYSLHIYNNLDKEPIILKIKNITSPGQAKLITFKGRLLIYLFSENLLYEFNGKSVSPSSILTPFYSSNIKQVGIKSLNDSLLCLYGYDGFYLFNENKVDGHYFKGIQVSTVLNDVENNLWVGTLQEGVHVIPSLNINQVLFDDKLNKKERFNRIVSIPGGFVSGTISGKLVLLNERSEFVKELQLETKSDIQAIHYNHSNDKIYVYCDKVYELNAKDLKLIKTTRVTSTKKILFVKDTLYCATSGGLIELVGDSAIHYLRGSWVNSLALDQMKIWFGTQNGLFYLDKNKAVKQFYHELIDGKLIRNIVNSSKGVLLTANNAVIRVENNTCSQVLRVDNSSTLRKIIEKDKFIYCLTENDILRYDSENKTTLKINQAKGLSAGSINDFEVVGETIFILFDKTIQVLPTTELNTYKPLLVLSDLGGTFNYSSDRYNSQYSNNELEFKLLALPNFKSRLSNTFYYKLAGYESDWSILNANMANQFIKYQNLPSGNYKLLVKSTNEDGVSTPIYETLFFIDKPYWLKWYFIGACLLIFIGFFYTFYSYRVNYIRKKLLKNIEHEKVKNRLLSAELTSIRSQMNPHFIFNCLSSIQSFILSGKKMEAYNNVNVFSKLVRAVLELSTIEYISLEKEFEFLKNYLFLESNRVDGSIKFDIILDEEIDSSAIKIPSLITQPFVENSIKHGLLHKEGLKEIKIKAYFNSNDDLVISIVDNGIGRDASTKINLQKLDKPKSFATTALNERIKRINNSKGMQVSIQYIDTNLGTEVILLFKF